jgi:dihydroorotase-like cyclic amidohydrolase
MKTIHTIRSQRVVTPEGVRPATVHLRHGVITAIAGYDDLPSGKNVYDAGESVVMPGLVDTHVHINEPGRTNWEGFDRGRARNKAQSSTQKMLGQRGFLGRSCARERERIARPA